MRNKKLLVKLKNSIIKWKKVPCYYEKLTYSEKEISRNCLYYSLIPLIFATGFINSALIYHNSITFALWLLFLLLLFHGNALLHYISSDAPNIFSIIDKVYVEPRSIISYRFSCAGWISFPLLMLVENHAVIYGIIVSWFYPNNPVENVSINSISWGENHAYGMYFLIIPIMWSYVSEKYLVGTSNKKLAVTFFLFILFPLIYVIAYIPVIGKITSPIFTLIGFQNILRIFSISGIVTAILFSIVFVVVKIENKARKIWGRYEN